MTNRSNSINIPEAREAMDKFKMEAASDHGVFSPIKLSGTAKKIHHDAASGSLNTSSLSTGPLLTSRTDSSVTSPTNR